MQHGSLKSKDDDDYDNEDDDVKAVFPVEALPTLKGYVKVTVHGVWTWTYFIYCLLQRKLSKPAVLEYRNHNSIWP